MFPPSRTRTRAAFLRAMDRAIEFATLGEYGLEVPGADAPTAPGTGRIAHSGARRPGAVASPAEPPRRVPAATPAGRRAAAGELAPVQVVPRPLFRHRCGEVEPRPQLCELEL